MAVQKSKKSRAKKKIRMHNNTIFVIPTLTKDKDTGEIHLRHYITKNGFYKGKRILPEKKNKNKEHQ